jgi:hypothetical protein
MKNLKNLSAIIPGKLQYSKKVALSSILLYELLLDDEDAALNAKSLYKSLKYGTKESFMNLLSSFSLKSSTSMN